MRAAIRPTLACGRCARCAGVGACVEPVLLGVHEHGAFAEFVRVPAAAVHRIPDRLPFRYAAYVEPVAAALGLANAGLAKGARGVIYGKNRTAELAWRVLRLLGVTDVWIHDPVRDGALAPGAYDFAVDAQLDARALDAMLRAVRPGGTLALLTRKNDPAPLDVGLAVQKDLTLRAVGYGSFPEAIQLLADGRLDLDDLLGPAHGLSDFEAVFAEARKSEVRRLFLAPCGLD
jgi:threonine dehydrogenase-like Zn-dependent dehydrogenase